MSTNLKSPKASAPGDGDKRNRNKDELKERSASMSKVKSSEDITRGRARTSSFSQKDASFSSRKEKNAKSDESEKLQPFTPSSTNNNKRSKMQTTPTSTVKEASNSNKASSKVSIKKSDSDDDSVKSSLKKDKKKTIEKPSRPESAKKDRRFKENFFSKRTADAFEQPGSSISEQKDDDTDCAVSFLKKRRSDDSSLFKSTSSTTTKATLPSINDEYEFRDDEEEEVPSRVLSKHRSTSPAVSSKGGTKFLDLAKKDPPTKSNRPQSDITEINKADKPVLGKKAGSVPPLPPPTEEAQPSTSVVDEEAKEMLSVTENRTTPTTSSSKESFSVVPKSESLTHDLSQIPSTSTITENFNTESYISQSTSLSVDSSAYLQSSGEDQEVEKILANTEAQKEADKTEVKLESEDLLAENLNEAQQPSLFAVPSASGVQDEPDHVDHDNNEFDVAYSPMLGPLVVAEDEEMEVQEEQRLDSKSPSCEAKDTNIETSVPSNSFVTENNDNIVSSLESNKEYDEEEEEKNLSEDTQIADSGESNASKADNESTSSVNSLLLCEETVPASPPSSPLPISSQAPEPSSLHHPAPSQSMQSEYFRSQLATHPSIPIDPRLSPFIIKDQVITQAELLGAKLPFSTTPAFLANLHRSQTQLASAQPAISLPPSTSQPFSTLIAAAVSQQQVPTNLSKLPSTKAPKTLNVIVPPNIASNIMKMDTSRVRSSREEEIAENFADDEGGQGLEIDDDDDENDSDADAKPFSRKMVEAPLSRKRRTIRSDSKLSSSSSPAPTGILSSQESSQDGDDHSIDEELQKIVAEEKKLRSKSLHKSDFDLKNDDDSSQSRSTRDNSKNFKSPASSPKKRRRGRMRNLSQSDNRDTLGRESIYSERSRERSVGSKTRGKFILKYSLYIYLYVTSFKCLHLYFLGRSRHSTGPVSHADVGFGGDNSSDFLTRSSTVGESSSIYSSVNLSNNISAILANLKPPELVPYDYSQWGHINTERHPYMIQISMDLTPEQRLAVLAEKIEEARRIYFERKAKQTDLERKRKRAMQKKKDRERKEQRELAKANAANAANATQSGSESSSSQNERSSRSSTRRDNGNGRSSAKQEDVVAGSDNGKKEAKEEAT